MSGVDTDYYMRIDVYSLQMPYHMIDWSTTNFLALLDLVLAHIYILWKFIHEETSEMRTCEISIYDLLKKCIYLQDLKTLCKRGLAQTRTYLMVYVDQHQTRTNGGALLSCRESRSQYPGTD